VLCRSVALLALVASFAHAADATGMEQTFTLSHPLEAGASPWLEVRVGPLTAGQRVRVTTLQGELIGTIAPFGPAARQGGGVYSLRVPPDAIHGDALSVRVTVTQSNVSPRAPNATEVQSLRLIAPDTAK
jgi:hypothetical protein